jgi:hypothetical protein
MSWCENYVVHCCLQSELSEFIFRVAGSRYLDWLTQCFSNVSCSWSLFDLHSSVWPPTPPPRPFIDSVACEKKLLFHRFWFYVRIYFYLIYLHDFIIFKYIAYV